MRSRFVRVLAVGTAVALFASGCMLSRAVDRAYLGISVRRPQYTDHRSTGVFLLPFTFAVDIVTFPIQAILVVILGDGFPFNDANETSAVIVLRDDPRFQKLSPAQQAVAVEELERLLADGQVTRNTALGLGDDGHWARVAVTDEAREQLIARAQQPVQAPQAIARCAP